VGRISKRWNQSRATTQNDATNKVSLGLHNEADESFPRIGRVGGNKMGEGGQPVRLLKELSQRRKLSEGGRRGKGTREELGIEAVEVVGGVSS